MYEKLKESRPHLPGYRIGGKVSDAEIRALWHELEDSIRLHGRIRVLVRIESLQGLEPRALWSDLRGAIHNHRRIERMAVVSDAGWHRWVMPLARPFLSGPVRCFPSAETAAAWAWLES